MHCEFRSKGIYIIWKYIHMPFTPLVSTWVFHSTRTVKKITLLATIPEQCFCLTFFIWFSCIILLLKHWIVKKKKIERKYQVPIIDMKQPKQSSPYHQVLVLSKVSDACWAVLHRCPLSSLRIHRGSLPPQEIVHQQKSY